MRSSVASTLRSKAHGRNDSSVSAPWARDIVRMNSRLVLEGKAKHQPYQKQARPKEQPFQLLVDIQGKMAEGKSVGYKRWANQV